MDSQTKLDETNPLGIFLVKSGSKGDRLLFRYPVSCDKNKESLVKRNKKNPYTLAIPDDHLGATRPVPRTAQCDHTLDGFPDQVLAKLFACQTTLCGKKFELKVKDVRFVGHPILLKSSRSSSSIHTFHVVFALMANANASVVNRYHDFSKRIAIALEHEEQRCDYLSHQAKIMLRCHDNESTKAEADSEMSPYYSILSCSELANDLKRVYEDIKNMGEVHMRIHRWIVLSFCLPNKVHRLHTKNLNIDHEDLLVCLQELKPYHGILLLVEPRELSDILPLDSSPALFRLIALTTPLKSFQILSLDCDLSLLQVFQLAAHLIYYAKASLIYPLCENNVYILAPNAPTHIHSPLEEKFREVFPNHSLTDVMAQFSLPTSLGDLFTPFRNDQNLHVRTVVWLLQHRLIMQLHTYIYLVTDCHTPSKEPHTSALRAEGEKGYPSDKLSGLLTNLTPAERQAVLALPAASNLEDLKLFDRLSKYMRGLHHIEEIMYLENIRRSQILTLVEKFQNVLVTVQHGDPSLSLFYT